MGVVKGVKEGEEGGQGWNPPSFAIKLGNLILYLVVYCKH
jgi:hypothetical protein